MSGEEASGQRKARFNNNNKNFKNREKFVPTFKKKVPTWKQIEEELKVLSDKYDQV